VWHSRTDAGTVGGADAIADDERRTDADANVVPEREPDGLPDDERRTEQLSDGDVVTDTAADARSDARRVPQRSRLAQDWQPLERLLVGGGPRAAVRGERVRRADRRGRLSRRVRVRPPHDDAVHVSVNDVTHELSDCSPNDLTAELAERAADGRADVCTFGCTLDESFVLAHTTAEQPPEPEADSDALFEPDWGTDVITEHGAVECAESCSVDESYIISHRTPDERAVVVAVEYAVVVVPDSRTFERAELGSVDESYSVAHNTTDACAEPCSLDESFIVAYRGTNRRPNARTIEPSNDVVADGRAVTAAHWRIDERPFTAPHTIADATSDSVAERTAASFAQRCAERCADERCADAHPVEPSFQ